MSKFSRWLDEVQDEEAGFAGDDGADDGLSFLPAWARSAVSSFDEGLDSFEDSLAAQQEKWTPPWLTSENVRESAQATVEATRRFRLFVATLLAAGALFVVAFAVGLPVLVLRPQKFALCFTLASLLFMAAFAALRGPAAQLRTLCEPRRLPFTAAYVATMAATLWAACLRRSYVYTALCSGLQMVTLLYYLGTYVPGGPRGVRLFLRAVAKTAALLLRPLCYACSKCCQQLLT